MITVLLLTTTAPPGVSDNSTVGAERTELPDDPDSDDPLAKCSISDSTQLDKNTTLALYAGDIERDFEDASQRAQWIDENCAVSGNFSGLGTRNSPFKTDQTFEKPPGDLTTELNRYQFQQFSVGNGYYPAGDDVANAKKVRIYYDQARIFSIENATKVHDGQGNVQTHIPQRGILRGFYHFNTTTRETPPPFRAVFPDPRPRFWRLTPGRIYDKDWEGGPYTDINIKNVCVVVNGGECGGSNDVTVEEISGVDRGPSGVSCVDKSCNRTGKYALKYNLSGHENVNRLVFRVELYQTWIEETWTCYAVDRIDCYADGGGPKYSEYYAPVTEPRTGSVTLTNSIQVTAANPNAELTVAKFPDGSAQARVRTNHEVRRLLFGGSGGQIAPDSVQYQWSYFSKSPSYWRGSGREHQPVFIHAYPTRTYEMDPPYIGPQVREEAFGSTNGFSKNNLPANVNVDRVAQEYAPVDELILETIDPYNESSVKGWGITPDSEADIRITNRKVIKANITIEKTGGNKTHVWFQVTLTEADGDPIHTEKRPGTIYVGGDEYQTGTNGHVRVVKRRVGLVEARYVPVDWYRLDLSTAAYTAAEDKAYTGPARGLFALLYYLLRRTAPLWGSLLVVLYFLDKVVDVQLWPPWRVV